MSSERQPGLPTAISATRRWARRWIKAVESRRRLSGWLASLGLVALVTAAIELLNGQVPVLSLGVLYIFAVLPIAIVWGLAYAIAVAIASMLAFNFFFLPPLHTLALRDSENWFALAVYLVTGVVVSELAARARRRAVEAEEREREAAELAEKTVEAEALRRSDAAKTALLRAVSHDLRSPLTAIKAATEGLESTTFRLGSAQRAELLAAIRLEAERLDRLVTNLLDLSRLEVGAVNAKPELWSVDELVGRALDALSLEVTRVTVSLPDQATLVEVDAGQIERALVNLLENALKFSSPENRVSLSVDVGRGEVIVAVRDQGVGLPPEDLELIFEPFQRSSGSSGRVGAGLGLAIVRGFAQANGGRVWAKSDGRGATFFLALPTVESAVVMPA
jgi:two-component system sensor histidine kinase KdpD